MTQFEAVDPDGSVELCAVDGESGVYHVPSRHNSENTSTTQVGQPGSGLPSRLGLMNINTRRIVSTRRDSADRADWFGVGIPAGPPVRFTVQTDTFRPVTAAAVVNGGTGYVVGDIITPPWNPAGPIANRSPGSASG